MDPKEISLKIEIYADKKLILFSRDTLLKYKEKIIAANIPVLRKKKDGTLVTILLEKLDVYVAGQNIDFYIEENWLASLDRERFNVRVAPPENKPLSREALQANIFKVEKMGAHEKKSFLESIIDQLDNLQRNKDLDNSRLARKAGVLLAKTSLLNAVSLNETEKIEANIELIKYNIKIVNELIQLIEKKELKLNELGSLYSITGSSTFDHYVRTTLIFILYAKYFNYYIGQNNGGSRLRVDYPAHYLKYYRSLVPSIKTTIEYVFKDGVRQLDDALIRNCALGVLLHDLAKYPDLAYHDGTAPYDNKKVRTHALQGYITLSKILSKLQVADKFFSAEDLALMAALHHDYYDHSLRSADRYPTAGMILQTKIDPGKARKDIRYVMSYDSKDFFKPNRERALAFLPAKMLEIVDIYDALTDKNKKRRNSYDHVEALKIMRIEFLDKDQKIDPILFNIFIDFLQAQLIKIELPRYI